MLWELYSIIQYFAITYNGIESENTVYICVYICALYIYIHIHTHIYIHTHIIYILSCILETHTL